MEEEKREEERGREVEREEEKREEERERKRRERKREGRESYIVLNFLLNMCCSCFTDRKSSIGHGGRNTRLHLT